MNFGERAVYATAALTVLAAATALLSSLPQSARTIEGRAQLAQAEPGPVVAGLNALPWWVPVVVVLCMLAMAVWVGPYWAPPGAREEASES